MAGRGGLYANQRIAARIAADDREGWRSIQILAVDFLGLLYVASQPCCGQRQPSARDCASAGSTAGMTQDTLMVMCLMPS